MVAPGGTARITLTVVMRTRVQPDRRAAGTFRDLLRTLVVIGLAGASGMVALRLFFSRAGEFRAKAREGQPIVRAVEEFRRQTGAYPQSLADLVPRFLPTLPELPDRAQHKFDGWDYYPVSNGTSTSFRLRYYLGRGGIEYEPPRWIGNDEGRRTVLPSNP